MGEREVKEETLHYDHDNCLNEESAIVVDAEPIEDSVNMQVSYRVHPD